MRPLVATLAIAALLALSAAPVMAAPADVFISDPVTGGVLDCGANQYTFTSGAWRNVVHAGDTSPSGNFQFSVIGSAYNVTLRDEAGNLYRLEGMWHFGGTYVAGIDATPFHFGMHLQVLRQGGGAVDDVSAVLTGSPFRDLWIDIGTCTPLG